MSTSVPLLREELVEASVLRCIANGLADYGLVKQTGDYAGPAPNLVLREAFPTPDERAEELKATTLAFGFNVDDGGTPGEMGSSLTFYVHTLTCWVFALEPRFGRKVAYALQHIARRGPGPFGLPDTIPLLDFNADADNPPQLDSLNVLSVQVSHQGNNSVRPWDRYVWTAGINVRDAAYMA